MALAVFSRNQVGRVERTELTKDAYQVIANELPAQQAIQKTIVDHLDILPSSLDLAGAEPYLEMTNGATLLFVCLSAFLSLVLGTRQIGETSFRAGGYAGEWLASMLAGYLNRTGSVIVVLTLIFLSIIMSTQFSFGRLFGAILKGFASLTSGAWSSFRAWQEERRRRPASHEEQVPAEEERLAQVVRHAGFGLLRHVSPRRASTT